MKRTQICKAELKEPFVLNKFKTIIIIYKSKADSSVNLITTMLKNGFMAKGTNINVANIPNRNLLMWFKDISLFFFSNLVNKKTCADKVLPLLSKQGWCNSWNEN